MTALLAAPAAVRPVTWQRLAWVAWRRYRTSLLAIAGVLALLSADLLVDGHRMRTAYAAVRACRPARSVSCEYGRNGFNNLYGQGGLVITVLILLPGLVGAFVGAPLLARELESGTFRYAWTQGVGRMRWTLAMLLPAAVGVSALMAAFGAVVAWHDQPLVAAGIANRLHASSFPSTGIAIVGWTLAGFALGVLAGTLWRRVVPALATAFAVWFGLAYEASRYRLHYQTPLTTTRLQLRPTDLNVDQWFDKDGVRVSPTELNHTLAAVGASFDSGGGKVTAHPGAGFVDPVHFLVQHGYTQVTSYQPDSRYWTFQWIETSWLLALSVLLVAVALLLVRRRSA